MVLLAPFFSTASVGKFLGVDTSPAFWWMSLVFVASGVSRAGQMIGHTNYLLELSPERNRQTYLSFYYATGAPLAFLPMLGAVLIGEKGNYVMGFAISLLLSVLMLWVLYGLHEVRGDANGTSSGTE
jgi:MFS family permease